MAPLLIVLCSSFVIAQEAAEGQGQRKTLQYAPAPIDNPLKGLVPYAGNGNDAFPHSLEFGYLPLSELVTAPNQYDWQPLEKLLEACAARGHQAVFRIYLEYPGKSDGIPEFLKKAGLRVHQYREPPPNESVEHFTPDYGNPQLRDVVRQFIGKLGEKYDGDPRIGFITAGLLGYWGEWHSWPRQDLFASPAVQAEVMDAYERAFQTTRVLVRFPMGMNQTEMAGNATRAFGYHDDSFAWSTLETPDKPWYFIAQLKSAGPAAFDKWKTAPIGGEIRPEAWGRVFDEQPGADVQDFRDCVEQTHVTWLLDSGLFDPKIATTARRRRAEAEVRRMGYEFTIPAISIGMPIDGALTVTIELANLGVAPFYYDWPIELGLIDKGRVVRSFRSNGKLTGLLPGDPPRVWRDTLDIRGIPAGAHRLAIRIPNPLPGGRPVRFANRTQDADISGWLTLGAVSVP